jgi:serine/threonine-protein kinase
MTNPQPRAHIRGTEPFTGYHREVTEHGSDPLIGELVDGRYQVQRRLALGGMSTVYLATDVRLRRDIALKVLYPHLAQDPVLVERFEAEAITAALLSHPHVVSVLDQGVDGSIAYLAMEYVAGRTLRDLLREHGSLAPRQALALLDAVVEGLAAAHDAGLVHRDIKPENVLLARNGQIKVADFGLARAATNQTSTGNLIGTVAYISPELVSGTPADARSDIYAVGIMLYEMLTGRQPFVADLPIAVAMRHIRDDLPAPSALLPGLAEDLDELVLWCAAKDPENRPHDAGALLGEIRQIRATLTDEQLDFGATGIDAAPVTPHDDAGRPSMDTHQTAVVGGGAGPETAGEPLIAHGTDAFAGEAGSALSAAHEDGTDATAVISTGRDWTTVIGSPHDATRALPRTDADGGAGALPDAAAFSGGTPPHDAASPVARGGSPASARALAKRSKREDKAARKEWAREAQRPLESLRPGRSRRRSWILGAVLVAAAILLGAAGWFFGLGPGSPFQIPSFGGQSASSAVQVLAAEGVDARQREIFDEQVKRGLVVGTDPGQGTQIRRFQSVEVLVSKGPELFGVPNVVGRDEAAARAALKAAQVSAGEVSQEYNESVEAGHIVSQAPVPDKQVRRGTAVSYVVSRGPAPINVPSVVGRNADDAQQILESAGLEGKKSGEEHSNSIAAGDVMSQEPANGTLKRGSTVNYVVSLGPRMIEVPNVRGKQIEDARRTLEELGFTVEIKEGTFGIIFGTVATQNPGSGSEAEGSTITLGVV